MTTVADAFRDAACGRVVAMLARKEDAPENVVRRLATALEEAPVVVPKPVMRLDTCLVMIFLGVLLGLVCRHVWAERTISIQVSEEESEDNSDMPSDATLAR